ncbi:putative ribonuclease H-like domain-containing protein, partial [Tanacetum coccineum]
VPRSVQLNAGRPKLNSIRPNTNTGRTNISSGRSKVNTVSPKVNAVSPKVNVVGPQVNTVNSKVNTVRPKQPVPNQTSNSMSPKRPQMNQRRDFSKSYSSVRRPFAKTTAQMSHFNAVVGNWGSAVKTSASYNWRNTRPNFHYNSGPTFIRTVNAKGPQGRPKPAKAWVTHMTGNKDQLEDFEEFNGGSVTFGGSKGYISGKGKIRVGNLDFDSVSFVKELGHFNLFSISQICDKQHKVLFTETECLVVSSDFKMPDENQILLKVPRHHNMYSFDMKTPTPAKGFACLIAKATSDESKLWHRRLGHINFKNLNKLVKGNLVRGLPSKVFKNDHTCVACHKGKQHRASWYLNQLNAGSLELLILGSDPVILLIAKSLIPSPDRRKAQVQFEAQSYTEEDWDTIRAKLEANAELRENVLGKDLSVEDYAKRMVELVNQRRKHFAEERARAKRNKPDANTELKELMSKLLKNQGT